MLSQHGKCLAFWQWVKCLANDTKWHTAERFVSLATEHGVISWSYDLISLGIYTLLLVKYNDRARLRNGGVKAGLSPSHESPDGLS